MKKLLVAALFASAFGLTGGPAAAGHCFDGDPWNGEFPPDWDCDIFHEECGYDSVQQETATGQNYEGAAYGFAVDRAGGPVTIRCYITVNGVPAAGGSTPTGSGVGFASTAGPISFEASDGADVELCTEVNGVTTTCSDSTNTQIPPQEVIDLIVFITSIPDPLICPIIEDIAGLGVEVPGVLEFGDPNDPADVYLLGELFWDCPPYEPAV